MKTAGMSLMNPRLILIAGGTEGRVIELTDGELTIGRDASNSVPLQDRSVSRRHCALRRQGDDYRVVDLGSHNGTFVNGVPVNDHVARHGDRLQVGKTAFIFLLTSEDSSPPADLVFENEAPGSMTTLRLRADSAPDLLPRELNTLVRIGATINSIRTLGELGPQILASLLEVIPAERGALVLTDATLERPTAVFSLDRLSRQSGTVNVSRTVVKSVLSERVAVLSNDAQQSHAHASADSLRALGAASLLCVPLTLLNDTLGFIYLDASSPGVAFAEGDLHMATLVAGLAAGALDSAQRLEWLENENRRLKAELRIDHNMIGESPRMREVFQRIARLAPAQSTVLIRGESGTGKELAARAIHQNGPRAAKPFVAVNCAALTESLLESELMGHEKGAFTGAIAQKKGKLEVANGGTIFLDEVGELSPPIQAKLLRFLQEREFDRVGGTRPIKVDVRVIAATNRNLEELIEGGGFRGDFYFRLNVVTLELPPLRDRPSDISLLATHFVAKYGERCKRHLTGISRTARECLLNYDWPGNVRELENAVEHAVVFGSTEMVEPEDLPEKILEKTAPSSPSRMAYYEAVKEAKRRIILKALEDARGSYPKAAQALGIHPNNLHRLARTLNIKPDAKR